MRTKGPFFLVLVLLLLTGAAVAVLVGDLRSHPAADERSLAFQRLVGGLGFGPAVDLGNCPFAFDPRLGCSCQQDQGPIAGGAWFCPHHAGAVFYYPPLVRP